MPCPAIEGRRPGPVTALMCSDVAYGEMIFDTHHAHPVSFRLAERVMRQRLLFVTDAMRGTGEVDGPSQLGGQDVRIRDGVVRLPDGTLAGSVLTLDQALRHALDAGMSLRKRRVWSARMPSPIWGCMTGGPLRRISWQISRFLMTGFRSAKSG